MPTLSDTDYQFLSTLPQWVIIILLILLVFKDAIGKLLSEHFPKMAIQHFEARSTRRGKIEAAEQESEKILLEQQLAASEDFRHQYAVREKEYIEIIKGMVEFIKTLITREIQDARQTLSKEFFTGNEGISKQVSEILTAVQRLEKTIRGERTSTGELLLGKIEERKDKR